MIYSLVLADYIMAETVTPKLEEPSLLRASRLIRSDSVDVFNKHMSAMLHDHRARADEAESDRKRKTSRYQRTQHILDYAPLLQARMVASYRRLLLNTAVKVVRDKRRQLRQEGFRI